MTGWAAELPLAQVWQAHGYQRQQAQSQNKKTRQPLHTCPPWYTSPYPHTRTCRLILELAIDSPHGSAAGQLHVKPGTTTASSQGA